MAGPGDETAAGAGGHPDLRASHADRDQVIDVLKAAFVAGRLDRDELGLRVGQALASRTCAELAALTADLPRPVNVPPRIKTPREAIAYYQRAVTDQERMHGPYHADTIAARAGRAAAFRAAGRLRDAIGPYERVLADRERAEGADHLLAIAARANLAFAYRSAGRFRDAIPQYERTLRTGSRSRGRITRTPWPRGPTWPPATSRPAG